ncbi:ATP-binding protein [Thalassotalea fusca]
MTSNIKSTSGAKFHRLSTRIVTRFCIFTIVMAAIYTGFSFLLLYNLEDNFINRDVYNEAQYLHSQYELTGKWPTSRNQSMSLYFSVDELPSDLKEQHIAEPNRPEFYGDDQRHYHLYKFPIEESVFLVAEVSEMLIVRPLKGGIFKMLLVLGAVLIVVAFFIAWLLGRQTAKPLKQLAELVDGAAPENIPDTFAHQFPRNEIGILAQTLEDAMGRIKQALAREKCFTRDVSHELRTPVAIVKNAVEVYRSTPASGQEKSAYDSIFNRIEQASVQMEQTVTTLLALAREEHTSAEKIATPIMPMIEQSIIDNSRLLQGKDVDVVVEDNCAAVAEVQPGMLKILLDNLLSNAFQYTEQGKVTASFQSGQLTIADTGDGIEPEISSKITEPAVKGSQSTGYGFGLSIVKRLCEHQGWQLTVKSEQGTAISVKF